MFVTFADTPPVLWIYAAMVFAVAGFVKGVVGLGLPTLSMALLALQMPPSLAAALLIVPSLATNLWQLQPLGTLPPLLRRLAPMQAAVFVGTIATAWLIGPPSGRMPTMLLGLTLVGYGIWGLLGVRPSVRPVVQVWLGPIAGAVTGAIASMTGVFVMPAVAYLQAIGLSRDELIQAMGVSFTVSTAALAIGLSISDQYQGVFVFASMAQLLPAVLGMWVGQRLRERLSPALFRIAMFVTLSLLGGHMVIRALTQA